MTWNCRVVKAGDGVAAHALDDDDTGSAVSWDVARFQVAGESVADVIEVMTLIIEELRQGPVIELPASSSPVRSCPQAAPLPQ